MNVDKTFYTQVHYGEEYKVYDINNFIGDFGGYLGLLLGGSIPGLLDLIESFIQVLMNKCWKRNQAPIQIDVATQLK